MKWKTYLLMTGMAALIAAGATWQIQSWRYQAQLATVAAAHQIDLAVKEQVLQAMKDAASRQLQAQQAQQEEQAQRIATLDAKHYKELRHAKNEVSSLRTDLTAGRRRLYIDTVPSTNSTSSNTVPTTASTAGLDDGAVRTELHPAVAGSLVGITGDADECAAKLTALQQWVKTLPTP